MSNAPTDAPDPPTDLAGSLRAEARFGLGFLRRHGTRLALAFAGVLLPLMIFGAFIHELREGEGFFFDVPVLEFARRLAREGLDRFFVFMAAIGHLYGVVPVDALLIAGLALYRKFREGLFAGLAILGSALLNVVAKRSFARPRPTLWESITPEHTFSFPSGHAMGSMTLACVAVLLCWPTRARWPVLIVASVFVVLVAMSRIYLGVHYPSDILAGWSAAAGWVFACYLLVFRHGEKPWQSVRSG